MMSAAEEVKKVAGATAGGVGGAVGASMLGSQIAIPASSVFATNVAGVLTTLGVSTAGAAFVPAGAALLMLGGLAAGTVAGYKLVKRMIED
jgi:hypothetical protein